MGRKQDSGQESTMIELLRDLLILELMKVGVSSHDIRKIVRCDLNRVTRTTKLLKGIGSSDPT